MEEVRKYINDDGSYNLYQIRCRVDDHLIYCGKEWIEISSERYGDNWVEIKVKPCKGDDFTIELNEGALVSNEEIHRAIPELIDDYFKCKEEGVPRGMKGFKGEDQIDTFRRKFSNKIYALSGFAKGAYEICEIVRDKNETSVGDAFRHITEQCDEIIKMMEEVWDGKYNN